MTGGHETPLYYAYAVQSGERRLFKRIGRSNKRPQWQELNVQGKITDPLPYPASRIVDSVWKGPVFVNPYRPGELYVLTETGVRVSQNGGASFDADAVLTQLVTGGSAYPLTPGFSGGDGTGVRFANRSDLNPMGALSDVAFLRDDPGVAAACSPYTGLFYKSNGKWTDLNSFIGRPVAPISSVAIDTTTIYFATEGRGVFRLIGYQNAERWLWAKRRAQSSRP